MISKDDHADPGQKAFDFSKGIPTKGQEGKQYNNKKDKENEVGKT